jgi:hypothetical protein
MYPGDCFGKEERFYWPEKEDKVSITDDEVCLGDDPEKWL